MLLSCSGSVVQATFEGRIVAAKRLDLGRNAEARRAFVAEAHHMQVSSGAGVAAWRRGGAVACCAACLHCLPHLGNRSDPSAPHIIHICCGHFLSSRQITASSV